LTPITSEPNIQAHKQLSAKWPVPNSPIPHLKFCWVRIQSQTLPRHLFPSSSQCCVKYNSISSQFY